MRSSRKIILLVGMFLFCSCSSPADKPAPALDLEKEPTQILISEVYTGAEGQNQADFIELYNAGTGIADLEGYSLWYQLHDESEEILLTSWEDTTLVPPLGYYALVQEGQEFSVPPDRVFNQPLVPNRGGLSLRQQGKIVDQLSWGGGPSALAEGERAQEIQPGESLTRMTALEAETSLDTDNNQTDFQLDSLPALQNTGSLINHSSAGKLSLELDFPELVKPGEDFLASLTVSNQTEQDLEGVQIYFTLPEHIFPQDPAAFPLEQSGAGVDLPLLEAGGQLVFELPLQADYTFSDFAIHNTRVQAANWPLPAFLGPRYGEIGGGAIPIATARELIDREVVVQGTSTMYVGGFYAGSGAKFYLQDDSGGIQVYVSGAGNSLVVPLGSIVQVRGEIQIYRDSIELVPSSEDQVEILEPGSGEDGLQPLPVTLEELSTQPENFPGQLLTVEGQVGRAEEFTYSYEIDLLDEEGSLVSLYLDKETGITIEEVEADQFYRVTGILELFDGNWQLYPRLQSDLARVYAPGLYIQAEPPTTVLPGESFQVVYSVTNHDSREDQDLILRAAVDPQLEILEISQGGRQEGDFLIWEIPQIPGQGAEIQPGFTARIAGDSPYVQFTDYTIESENYPNPAGGIPSYTFAGETVPIWAIQGEGDRSPYLGSQLTTRGLVTGAFPELEGFWIQESPSDSDPATSPGLFIRTGPNLPPVQRGDLVSVTGLVREYFQQTELEIVSPANVEVIGSGTLPSPFILDPPPDEAASADYYESLEGQLVTVPGTAIVVGPTTRYGEYALVLPRHGMARSWQNQEHGMLIQVDDGSAITHESGDTLPYRLAVGDSVSGLIGPLSFTYGNYKIQPIAPYGTVTQPPALDALEPLPEGYLRLMSWNVENLFDFLVPHPSSPPLPTVSEYKRDISKVALTIEAAGFPTVIGLQEVENIGVLEDIAAEPILADYDYQAALIEGTDSRGIDVGYLVRGDRAEILDTVQYPAPGNITSRPPLLLSLQVAGRPETVYLLNNHFTSLSGGEEATEPRRNAQAAWNAEIAGEILAADPEGYLAVMGDLNSYYGSPPIQTLEDSGLTNLFDTLDADQRYTYVYQGNSQVLDHILVNPALLETLVELEILHSNADYPLPLSADESIFHTSDHDPVIATFILP